MAAAALRVVAFTVAAAAAPARNASAPLVVAGAHHSGAHHVAKALAALGAAAWAAIEAMSKVFDERATVPGVVAACDAAIAAGDDDFRAVYQVWR